MSYYAVTLLLSLILTPSSLRRSHRIRAAIRADAMPILIVAVFSPRAYILLLAAMFSMLQWSYFFPRWCTSP